MFLELLFGLAFGQAVTQTLPLRVQASFTPQGLCLQPGFRDGRQSTPGPPPEPARNADESATPHANTEAHALRTPMSQTEARLHLELAYRTVVRVAPESKSLRLLMAQWALETGRGQNMWGFNFGGIKAIAGGAAFGTGESFGRRKRRTVHQFRTYRNAFEGAKDYVRTLTYDFPKAFEALQSGCPTRFVQALSEERYFTGDPVEYQRAILRLAEEYERRWSGNERNEST